MLLGVLPCRRFALVIIRGTNMRRAGYSIFALCLSLCLCCGAGAQESKAIDGFMGRGIARISGGNIPEARQSALADAQRKVVIDSVNSLLPADTFAAYSSRILNRFAAKPERFLQSFKIVSENALPDQYQVTLQAAVQLDVVRRELVALGLIKSDESKSVALLVMASEKGLDSAPEIFWWSVTAGTTLAEFPLQQAVEAAFADKETRIISPFEPSLKETFSSVGLNADPDSTAICQLAMQTDARMVLLLKASLKRVKDNRLVSVQNVQCDSTARLIDIRSREVVAQAVTCGLGMHVDEAAACQEAIQKAARQLADQITERLYQQLRQVREYVFKLRFNKSVSDADVRDCINAFKVVLPGLELVDVATEDGRERWTVRVTSPADDATALQKMFGSGVAGYITKITSVHENVLELRVTPIKR